MHISPQLGSLCCWFGLTHIYQHFLHGSTWQRFAMHLFSTVSWRGRIVSMLLIHNQEGYRWVSEPNSLYGSLRIRDYMRLYSLLRLDPVPACFLLICDTIMLINHRGQGIIIPFWRVHSSATQLLLLNDWSCHLLTALVQFVHHPRDLCTIPRTLPL